MEAGDDLVRVRQSTLIGLAHDARALPLLSSSVRAQVAGGHLSALRGRGMEYHESRPYQPGDDIRAIDWRVTARSGRAHTKVYREERERPVLLWLDLTRSMFFGTRACFKSVLAAKAATLIAWSAVQHGDRVGFQVFSASRHEERRPARGQRAVMQFVRCLVDHPAWLARGDAALDAGAAMQALLRLRQVARPGSLVFLASDFRHVDPAWRRQLAGLSRHSDVVLLHCHDPFERELPRAGIFRVTDCVDDVEFDAAGRGLRDRYRERYQRAQRELERLCAELGIFLIDLATDGDLLAGLQAGLGGRRR